MSTSHSSHDEPRFPPDDLKVDFGTPSPGSDNPMPDDVRAAYEERILNSTKAIGHPGTVPHAEYARVKTHLYGRIETLIARAERAENELMKLADIHHRTITASAKHNPVQQDWPDCECKTCAAVASLLPEHADEARRRFAIQRESTGKDGDDA